MPATYRVTVYQNKARLDEFQLSCPVEFGRRRDGEASPPRLVMSQDGKSARFVLANFRELGISKQQFVIEPLADRCRVTNLSQKQPLKIAGRTKPALHYHESHEFETTGEISFYNDHGFSIVVAVVAASAAPDVSPTNPPTGSANSTSSKVRSPEEQELWNWLRAHVLTPIEEARTITDLWAAVSSGVGRLHDFDFALNVFPRPGNRWEFPADPRADYVMSTSLLHAAKERKKLLIWPADSVVAGMSGELLKFAVSAPVLLDGEVAAVVYAAVKLRPAGEPQPRDLPAGLQERLAAVTKAAERRLSGLKKEHPSSYTLLSTLSTAPVAPLPPGQTSYSDNTTFLFTDLRRWTDICARLGRDAPELPEEWNRDWQAAALESARAHGGRLPDSLPHGDEVYLVWERREHSDGPARACRFAFDYLARLAGVDSKWRPRTELPTTAGVGVHFGLVRHALSTHGEIQRVAPVGLPVSITNRLQSATRKIGVPVLVTEPAHGEVATCGEFLTRPVALWRGQGMTAPLGIFEVRPRTGPEVVAWEAGFANFAPLLDAFNTCSGEHSALLGLIAQLSAHCLNYKWDQPAKHLLDRVMTAWKRKPDDAFDPVWYDEK
jgi:class 3 adenylate cyclase